MAAVNAVDAFRKELARELPAAVVEVDAPDDPNGAWWIDVFWNDLSIAVEWRPKLGYGISLEPVGYGEGAEYIYDFADEAARVVARSLRKQQSDDGVLIVSADASVQIDIDKELRRRNIRVVVTSNAAAATEHLLANSFKVIIVDLLHLDDALMQTIRNIEATDRQKLITFVVGTTFKDVPSDIVHAAFRAPITIREIADMVELTLRELRRSLAAAGDSSNTDVSLSWWSPH